MNVWASVNSMFRAAPGRRWSPRQGGVRVGRDVAAMKATTVNVASSREKVIGQAEDVRLKTNAIFANARADAMAGRTPRHFSDRAYDPEYRDRAGFSTAHGNGLEDSVVLATQGDWAVAHDASGGRNELLFFRRDEELGRYQEVRRVAIKDDMRLSWDENGAPTITTGHEALTKGRLEARSSADILVRVSDVDVTAGENTVVYNLSDKAGHFSGGRNVTYLGAYQGGTFTDTRGDVTFAGYFSGAEFSGLAGGSVFSGVFEQATVELTEGTGVFSGYFAQSSISGGEQGDVMSGLFLNGTVVRGGAGDDAFHGRFMDSVVEGGDGDDSFGQAASMERGERLSHQRGNQSSQKYTGLVADFLNSTVNAGAGNDTMRGVMAGGTLNLEEGENTVNAVFENATVNGGDEKDSITARYAENSVFHTGAGEDDIRLNTATQSAVQAGEGKNSITLGEGETPVARHSWQSGRAHLDGEKAYAESVINDVTVQNDVNNAAEQSETSVNHQGRAHTPGQAERNVASLWRSHSMREAVRRYDALAGTLSWSGRVI